MDPGHTRKVLFHSKLPDPKKIQFEVDLAILKQRNFSLLGVSLKGRALRCNLLLFEKKSKRIFTSIPNANFRS